MLEIIRNERLGLVAPKTCVFSDKAPEILEGLDGMRRNKPQFEDMSLGRYLAYWSSEKNEAKLDLSAENQDHLVREFNMSLGFLDTGKVTVKSFRQNTTDATQRWMFPELIRAAIEEGVGDGAIHAEIVAAQENVEGERIAVMPSIKFMQKPERIREGQDIPESMVEYKSRNVPIYPHGLGIKFSYDALDGMSMDMFGKFLATQGTIMGLSYDAIAIDVLYSGDQNDSSQSAAVIGVDNTTDGFQYADFLRAAIQLAGQGFMLDSIVCDFAQAKKLFNLEEFKVRGEGTALIIPKRNIPLPNEINIFAKSNATTNQIVCFDSRNALVEFTGEPLLIENQRNIWERSEGTAITARVGFGNLYRTARIVFDVSQTYGGSGYGIDDYSWFTPLDLIPAANL